MNRFLLVNDDGIFAPGLKALMESVEGAGEVVVVAPDRERSGMGHAITVNQPLRVKQIKQGYMVNGTPADCVKMAVEALDFQPDFVLSGINAGSNLGTDVLYSGTVAAALEGVLNGIPSIAVSLCGSAQYLSTAGELLRELLFGEPGLLKRPELLPDGGVLNINIPALPREEIKGILLTRLGVRKYEGLLQRRQDPNGHYYYWMGGTPAPLESDELEIDLVAVDQGYISITPLQFDLTFHQELNRLKSLLES